MRHSILKMPNTILYGSGSFKKIGIEASMKGNRALIISDEIMEKLGYIDDCKKQLNKSNMFYSTYLGIDSEPTDIFVEKALDILRQNDCDVILAIGGGSCLDTAKAVAVLATNKTDLSDYIGDNKLVENKPIPLIAVPTTAGTGSEATDVTVITNTKTDVKMMIKQPAFLPDVAIVDPDLTVSAPPKVIATTGVDALTHGIEAFISRKSHPFTDTLALAAIKNLIENLPQAYNDGPSIATMDKLSLAAMQAGIAFSNSSVCLVHGMSRPIGAMFNVPHGISNAMLLPGVLDYTKEYCIERLADIGRFIDTNLNNKKDNVIASEVVTKIKRLCLRLEIPNMKHWGIEEKEFKVACKKMAKDAIDSGSPSNNPRVPSEKEIIDLYHYCYHYNYEDLRKEVQY